MKLMKDSSRLTKYQTHCKGCIGANITIMFTRFKFKNSSKASLKAICSGLCQWGCLKCPTQCDKAVS